LVIHIAIPQLKLSQLDIFTANERQCCRIVLKATSDARFVQYFFSPSFVHPVYDIYMMISAFLADFKS
jgi:hypothetical protein